MDDPRSPAGAPGDLAAGAHVPAVPAVCTPDEAAEILKCTTSWLKELARKRRIPFTMISGLPVDRCSPGEDHPDRRAPGRTGVPVAHLRAQAAQGASGR